MKYEYQASHPHDPDAYGRGEYFARVSPTTQSATSATGAEPGRVNMAAMRAQSEDHHLRTLEEIVEIYGASKVGREWKALCPVHNDHHPDLSIAQGYKGGIVMTCWSHRCDIKQVLAAKGLSYADITPPSKGYAPVDEYIYTDAAGDPVYLVQRLENPLAAKPKIFPQSHWENDHWLPGNQCEPLLFHLPRVLQAIRDGQTIFVVEGEKDVLTAEALGLVATTHSGGALANAKQKALSAYEALRGAHSVVILPDTDGVGLVSGRVIADHIATFVSSVKMVLLPNGRDITGWTQGGGTREQLEALIAGVKPSTGTTAAQPIREWTLQEMQATQFPEPRWIVPGLICPGLFIIAGRPKRAKKSWLVLDMASALSTGGDVLGRKVEQMRVLYLALEDFPRRIVDRTSKMRVKGNENLEIVCSNDAGEIRRRGIVSYLNDYMTRHPDTGAIFIDTLQCVRNIKDSNDYQQTYEEANSLKEVAYHYGIAIVIVHHTTKAIEGEDWANTIMGSTGLVAAADGYMVVRQAGKLLSARGKDIEDDDSAVQFDFTNWRYQMLGNAAQVAQSDARQEILDTLDLSGSVGMTPKEIAEAINGKPANVRQLLLKMKRDGMVQESHGKYKPLIIPFVRPTSE